MASSINNTAWLEWMTGLMGGVPRQAQAAAFPPDRFYCLLDELPVHLIPRAVSSEITADSDLRLNPDCSIGPADELPEEVQSCREFLAAFALQGTIAWVRDRARGSVLPFWLGSELGQLVRSLRPGELISALVPAKTRRLLAEAGILVPERQGTVSVERQETVEQASALFREKGYAPLAGLIHPFHVAALRRYYRQMIRSGVLELGDPQSPLRYTAYNESVARFFHRQITGALSAVAGEALKPSYVYMASYLAGAKLKKHLDREQCEFSITLCLDFSPEPALATPWPITLDTPRGSVTVYQALGDGLVYRGTRLPHYRAVLAEGQTSTSIFFHYVAQDFSGSLD